MSAPLARLSASEDITNKDTAGPGVLFATVLAGLSLQCLGKCTHERLCLRTVADYCNITAMGKIKNQIPSITSDKVLKMWIVYPLAK